MALTKRVEILFDPDEYRLVEQAARARGETVAALVRQAVAEKYLELDLQDRRRAAEDLISIESDVTWEEAKKILDEDIGRRL